MSVADMAPTKTLTASEPTSLLGCADTALTQLLANAMDGLTDVSRPAVASNLPELSLLVARTTPKVIIVDHALFQRAAFAEPLRQLAAKAPVILLAPPERQVEVARLVAGGEVEFVARVGDFVPLALGLIERRLRWAAMSNSVVGPPWAELPGDIATILRHEINNPLTGILGNAELLLAHRDRFSTVDTQRLQTVVNLAVRLRETTRRLSNAWESQTRSLKAAQPATEDRLDFRPPWEK
jgi:signal transduction histidine kinase